MLHAREDLLVVLNHPLWDEADIGAGIIARRWLPCFRAWQMDSRHRVERLALVGREQETLELARAWHCRPSREATGTAWSQRQPEFDARGQFCGIRGGDPARTAQRVLFMPQYRETLGLRWFETVKDIVRCHPEAERPRWVDRFFYACEDGVTRPIAELWPNEGPALLRSVFAMLRLSESQSLRAALRLTMPTRRDATLAGSAHVPS